ncbi:NAD-dependent epimerase/dehydratase family protein [Geodermatophilus marinus]|uniref:NAD-dependent epimerase/dehydratase family protein n=1 Tax=Geodermatophilus sp. LHW52908 TaxID=2303986 RepID=UPI000E3DAE92|nr:NAD-dependent epimerase/dehydratase family protein [Geodermatophilus sp. LHW52908]RFU20286.1 NAD-dependent epimerase/dehydratase family protein [Geodermatophilus sp. LHW52908]
MEALTPDHLKGMTVAVTGASGNVGTALLRRLTDPASGVAEVRGLARRKPPETAPYDRVRWHLADLGEPTSRTLLGSFLDGADAVVHCAWALQPGLQPERLHRVNVDGTRRVVEAAVAAGVPHVVHLSSLGTYAGGGGDREVGEDWPTTGIPTSQYSRDKAEAERLLRELSARSPDTTVTVVRPTLVLQPEAGSEIARYFLGPLVFGAARLVPGRLARLLPLPLPDLRVQLIHADDVADGIVRMLDRRAPGPFNLAAGPTLDPGALAHALGTVRVPFPSLLLRTGLSAAFHTRVVPTEPGWLDIATQAPALDTGRARRLLDWTPAHRGDDVLRRFVAALGRGEGGTGPLLHPADAPSGQSPAG